MPDAVESAKIATSNLTLISESAKLRMMSAARQAATIDKGVKTLKLMAGAASGLKSHLPGRIQIEFPIVGADGSPMSINLNVADYPGLAADLNDLLCNHVGRAEELLVAATAAKIWS